ncbi:MAG: large conductance mechanosensitive channel protein MscL [Proteobacteria bacterium]|nr:large conductance mechanosensitive channel protein MscL [Pseudomonadota bacterium]
MLKEFKEFALKGNVVDLAVGVIIGAAFSKIVDSLVGDIIMPIVGAITGGVDFSNLMISLSGAASKAIATGAGYAKVKEAGAVLGYGQFLTVVVNFLIVAWVLFLVIKAMNSLKKAEPPAPPAAPPAELAVLTEIRDLLAKK